jgi:hypothetical protein
MWGKAKIVASEKATYIILAGWVTTTVAFYPGFMSADSINQYYQVLSGNYNAHHPVVFANLWSLLNKVVAGPFLMLLLQTTIYWASILILYLKKRKSRYSHLIILMGFSPNILCILGVIWKDVHFAVALIFIVATSLDRPKFRFTFLHLTLLLFEVSVLFYASNVRSNSLIVIPFVAFIWIRSYKPAFTRKRILALSLVFSFTAFFLGQFYTNDILKAKPSDISNIFLTENLIYFSILEKQSLIPEVTYEAIENCTKPVIAGMKLNMRYFCLEATEGYSVSKFDTKRMRTQLIHSVINHPWEFVKYKLAAYSEFEGTFLDKNYYYWHPGLDPNSVGLTQKDSILTILLRNYADFTINLLPFLFAPLFWLWLPAILILLCWSIRKRADTEVPLILSMSAFMYNFQYLIASTVPDYRYFYWSVIATTTSLILLYFISGKNLFRSFSELSPKYRIACLFFTLILIFQKQIFDHVDYSALLIG